MMQCSRSLWLNVELYQLHYRLLPRKGELDTALRLSVWPFIRPMRACNSRTEGRREFKSDRQIPRNDCNRPCHFQNGD